VVRPWSLLAISNGITASLFPPCIALDCNAVVLTVLLVLPADLKDSSLPLANTILSIKDF